MNVLARAPSSVRMLAASTVTLVGCQSILGIDSNRPLDTGSPDGDTGHQDAAGESDATPSDAFPASDASDANVGVDAAEASTTTDAGPDSGYTFLDPLQVDASSLFNANSVATTAVGGAPLTPMDGTGPSDDNDFPTQSEVDQIGGSGTGLPDDAFFAASGSSMPNVRLAWSDSSNVLNSIVVSSTAPTPYTLDLPPAQYTQVQIYATGTGGASTVNYTFMYSDSSTTQNAIVLPDWCVGKVTTNGQYVLASVDRVENNGTLFNDAYLCNIYALDLNPDPTKTLVSLTFSDTGSGNTSYFIFYGATAW
jgi:hypothetical protein